MKLKEEPPMFFLDCQSHLKWFSGMKPLLIRVLYGVDDETDAC